MRHIRTLEKRIAALEAELAEARREHDQSIDAALRFGAAVSAASGEIEGLDD